MDPTNRVNDLIVITGRLAELLERENDALRNRRHSELNEILEEKVTLGRVYESRIMGLTQEEDALESVDPELRERLRGAGEKVNELIDENAKMLKVAIAANRRVVDLIADAVKESSPNAGTYSPQGVTGGTTQSESAPVAPFSLDQSL